MEIFPSMTFNDVMDMPYKAFRELYTIRAKRKIKEQEELAEERKKIEEQNKRDLNKSSRGR